MRLAILQVQQRATSQCLGQVLAGGLTVLAVLLCAAVAPLLPTIAWKVKATMFAALSMAGAFYLRARTQGSFGRSPLDRPAAVFLAAAVLATIFSVDRLVSFYPSPLRGEGLMVVIAYVLIALGAARLSPRESALVITLLLLSASLVAAVAIAEFYGVEVLRWAGLTPTQFAASLRGGTLQVGVIPAVRFLGSMSTLANPMFLGAYVLLLLPLAIVRALGAARRSWPLYAAAALLLYGALLAAQNRASWIAATVAGILLLWLLPPSPSVRRRLAILVTGGAALTAIMILTRPDALLMQRAVSTVADFEGGGGTLGQRLYTWKHVLPLIAQRPVLGWGFSALLGRFPDLGSREYLRHFGTDAVILIDNPHNELLHVAFSTGLVGLAAYLWVWGTVTVVLIRTARGRTVPPGLHPAFIASLAAYFVWMQSAWSHIGPANVLWTSLGLAAALTRHEDSSAHTE